MSSICVVEFDAEVEGIGIVVEGERRAAKPAVLPARRARESSVTSALSSESPLSASERGEEEEEHAWLWLSRATRRREGVRGCGGAGRAVDVEGGSRLVASG